MLPLHKPSPWSPARWLCRGVVLLCLVGQALAFITVVAQPSPLGQGTCRDSSTRTFSTSIKYGGISHAGVLVSNTQKSLDFYLGILGFEDDTHLRPNLPFAGPSPLTRHARLLSVSPSDSLLLMMMDVAGAFVRGGAQQIHLMELPNPDPTSGRPEHGGRDRHVAFTIANIDPLVSRLNDKGWGFTMSKSGRRAVFCRDPDGNALEFMEDATVAS